jgi:hypothetical protein
MIIIITPILRLVFAMVFFKWLELLRLLKFFTIHFFAYNLRLKR